MLYIFHGYSQRYMPNLTEVYEDMVEDLLVLEIFLTEDSLVEDLLCGAPPCSEACLFFRNDLLRLWLQSFRMIFSMTLPGWLMRLIIQ